MQDSSLASSIPSTVYTLLDEILASGGAQALEPILEPETNNNMSLSYDISSMQESVTPL